MGIFSSLFHKKQKFQMNTLPDLGSMNEEGPWSNPSVKNDLNPLEIQSTRAMDSNQYEVPQMTPSQPTNNFNSGISDRDIQLILSKLDLINSRLDNLNRRFEMLEAGKKREIW